MIYHVCMESHTPKKERSQFMSASQVGSKLEEQMHYAT